MLDRAIDFAALARAVDAKRKIGDSGRSGRPPYPAELMIRLLQQQLCNLSDDAREYPVLDRSSFQRFAGLEKSRRIPDAEIVGVWRERLKAQDLIGDISEAVGQQLAQAGFIARGEVPKDWTAAKRAQKDVGARWTKKHGKSYYGDKLHASTDRRWGFIRRIKVTAASVNDPEVFEAISGRDQHRQGCLRRPRLRQARTGDRATRARLPGNHSAQQRRNRRVAQQRAFGEHLLARRRLAQMGASTCAPSGWPAHGRSSN